jgi:hypothetical protein
MNNSTQNTQNSEINQLTSNQFTFPQNFTEVEAAKWLKVSRITLQRIRLRNEIAFSRVGGTRVIYTLKHLEDYLASRERIAINAC